MNPDIVVYPNLISLEVSEADVLNRAADEQASRVRPSDAAAADKVKPEVMMLCLLLSACSTILKNTFNCRHCPL